MKIADIGAVEHMFDWDRRERKIEDFETQKQILRLGNQRHACMHECNVGSL